MGERQKAVERHSDRLRERKRVKVWKGERKRTTHHGQLHHGCAHLLVRHCRHLLDVTVELRHPLTVAGNVLGKEQLVGRRILVTTTRFSVIQ